jgi:signal transduction histidine kinase
MANTACGWAHSTSSASKGGMLKCASSCGRAPLAPVPRQPAPGTVLAADVVQLSWGPSAELNRYRLQVAGANGFGSPLLDRGVDGQQARLALPPGSYQWRVATWTRSDPIGNLRQGPFGLPQAFELRAVPPLPVLEPPQFSPTRLLLRWKALAAGQGLQLQLADNPAFNPVLIERSTWGSEWSVPRPAAGRYYLRIRSVVGDAPVGGFAAPVPAGCAGAALVGADLAPCRRHPALKPDPPSAVRHTCRGPPSPAPVTVWHRLRNHLDRLDEHWGAGLAAALAVPSASRLGLVWAPLLVVALVALLAGSPLRQPLADGLHDVALRAVARQAHFHEVLVIDIDDASLRALRPRLGGWPYSRDTYALAVSYLRELGARAIVLDIVLTEAREGDAALARTLAERQDVVLAAAGLRRSAGASPQEAASREHLSLPAAADEAATTWAGFSLPSDPLLAALASRPGVGSVGVISTPLDDDGLLRRLPLVHVAEGRLFPSLALAPQLLASEAAGAALQRSGHWLQIGTRRWPVDAEGRVGLRLPSNPDAVPRLAFSSLMVAALGLSEGAGLRDAVAGRTVFIGSSAYMADEVRTPMGSLPGSTLLATAHATLLRGEVLRQAPAPWSLALLGMALLPSVWLWLRRRPVLVQDALASLAALLGVLLLGVGVLGLAQVQLDMLLPMAAVAFGFVIATGLQLRWVGRANRQLAIERGVADAANRAKSELLAHVSHEIRTPLTALLGVAELLQRTPLNAEQQRYVEVFRSSGLTLFELINDLLDLAKAEAGQLSLQAEPFSLRAVLAEVQALMADRAAAKGLVLEWHADADLPERVLGDRRRLAQVLTNLVGNAVKFTAEGVSRWR